MWTAVPRTPSPTGPAATPTSTAWTALRTSPRRRPARLLGIDRDLDVDSRRITRSHQARLVMGMIRRFCYSTDRVLMARHMERVNGLTGPAQDFLARVLLPYAVRAWADLRSLKGRLKFTPDHYMKMWAMTKPVLPADFVLLDEAQDTNPVLEEVFLAQDAQRVCVGDPAQQIYGWRSARDVMRGFPAEHLHLTQSFRFGPPIAQVANRWLKHAESEMRLTGYGPRSRVGRAAHAEAVLCRGNADAMQEVLRCLDQGIPVALAGGGKALLRIAEAALQLKAGKRTSHHDLCLFATWDEVQEYVEQDDAAQDLKSIVKLVDKYGPDTIIDAVNRLASEDTAQVTVSTAHKSKGREWASVRIGEGFAAPSVDDTGTRRCLSAAEARLIYVSVSRARDLLDPAGIAWIDAYEKEMAHDGRDDRTVAGRPLISLSLTRQLKYTASPMSQFMAEHLPNSMTVVRDYLRRTCALPQPVQPIDVRYPDFAALGHTIDFRLRLSLGGTLGPAVSLGILAIGSDTPFPGAPHPATRAALHTAGKNLLASVNTYLEDPRSLDGAAVTRLCYVASFYEDLARSGEIHRFSMLADATPTTTLGDLTAAVPRHVIDDIDQQMALAEEPFAAFRALPQAAKTCGPVFVGSDDIGGADADFILGGLLLDCKATVKPHRLGREEIHQLVGYLLLDYDDRYHIDSVGLYLSRHGKIVTWNLDEFLDLLGVGLPLPALRTLLKRHLRRAQESSDH